MSYRSQFTTREWETLQFAPLWVFSLIAQADQKIERREIEALAKELAEAPLYKSELAQEVFMSIGLSLEAVWPAYQRDSRSVLDGLLETRQIVEAKLDSDEANKFKGALLTLGAEIIKAISKGPFGTTKDRSKEKAALVLAAITLGFAPG